MTTTDSGLSQNLIAAFGGKQNIKTLDACLTRLRVKVDEIAAVSQEQLKELGAKGVVIVEGEVQAIFGKEADTLRETMKAALETSPSGLASDLVAAFGGKENILTVDACLTRLRVGVNDTTSISQDKLKALGAKGVVLLEDNNVQAIFGKSSDALKAEMAEFIK